MFNKLKDETHEHSLQHISYRLFQQRVLTSCHSHNVFRSLSHTYVSFVASADLWVVWKRGKYRIRQWETHRKPLRKNNHVPTHAEVTDGRSNICLTNPTHPPVFCRIINRSHSLLTSPFPGLTPSFEEGFGTGIIIMLYAVLPTVNHRSMYYYRHKLEVHQETGLWGLALCAGMSIKESTFVLLGSRGTGVRKLLLSFS